MVSTVSVCSHSIKLIGDELDRRVKANQPAYGTHLWEHPQQIWEELSEEYVISVIKRMPQVCSAVKSARGQGPTLMSQMSFQ